MQPFVAPPPVRENRPKTAPPPMAPHRRDATSSMGPEPKPAQAPWLQRWLGLPQAARRYRQVAGLFVMLFSLFLLVALLSHLFTGRADESLTEYGAFPPVTVAEQPENSAGTVGAYLSNGLITQGYGIVALALPAYLFLLGYAILEDKLWHKVRKFFPYLLFSLHWVAFTLGYFTQLLGSPTMDLGGAVGLTLTDWGSFYLGMAGTGLVLVFSCLAFIVIKLHTALNLVTFWKPFVQVHTPSPISTTAQQQEPNFTTPIPPENFYDEVGEQEPAGGEDELEGSFILSVKKVMADQQNVIPTEHEKRVDRNMPLKEAVSEDIPFEITTHYQAPPMPSRGAFSLASTEQELEPEKDVVPQGPLHLTDNIQQVAAERFEKIIAPEDQEALEEDEIVADWEAFDPTRELAHYKYPPLELLKHYENPQGYEVNRAELEANKNRIIRTLQNYNIEILSIKATVGPTVTLYEIVPAAGVRISKIKGLEDDIALSLAALGIRIIAPMPGKGTIGIEIPNSTAEVVSFRSVVATEKFRDSKAELPLAMGKTIANEVYLADLTKMPHLLVAGATGQGKSVGLNCIIASLLYKKHPSQVKFVLIDPKKVEMALFQVLEKHFLAKLPNYEDAIITDNKQAVQVLTSLCMEMDQRYQLLKAARVRNLQEYNPKFMERRLNPRKGHRYLPYLVLVIDELADLMMTAGKEVEAPIIRLAQLGRAAGLHLIIATQRPSVNVITGILKANFPARLSYRVISKIDSRTILDVNGADQLIGRGDMLLSTGSEIIRVQNAFVDTAEIEQLVHFIGDQPGYSEPYYLPEVVEDANTEEEEPWDSAELDSLFEESARIVVRTQQGSTSLIQRKLSIGYNRAGRIMDQLEKCGVVGPAAGSKPRDVLVYDEAALERMLAAAA